MIKILHLITNLFVFRVHAIFEDDDEFEHYFIYPKYQPEISITFMKSGHQILNGKPKNHLVIDMKKINMAEIKKFIDKNDLHVVFLSNINPVPLIQNYLLTNKRFKIYFINHGIMNQNALNTVIKLNKVNKHPIWKNLHHIFITETEKRAWFRNPRYKSRTTILPGLTQIDLMKTIDYNYYKTLIFNHLDEDGFLTNKMNIRKDIPKSILFVNNKNSTYSKPKRGVETEKIFKFLDSYCEKNNYHLFPKLKHSAPWGVKFNKDPKEISYFKKKHITPVLYNEQNFDVPLYYFLFCDAIVIQNYGTSLIEALMIKPQVIRCQILKKDNQALMDKYPNLLQSHSLKSLEEHLDLIFSDQYPTPESEIDRANYLEMYLGSGYENKRSSDIILEKIKEQQS